MAALAEPAKALPDHAAIETREAWRDRESIIINRRTERADSCFANAKVPLSSHQCLACPNLLTTKALFR
jgi:hypothetical protein